MWEPWNVLKLHITIWNNVYDDVRNKRNVGLWQVCKLKKLLSKHSKWSYLVLTSWVTRKGARINKKLMILPSCNSYFNAIIYVNCSLFYYALYSMHCIVFFAFHAFYSKNCIIWIVFIHCIISVDTGLAYTYLVPIGTK